MPLLSEDAADVARKEAIRLSRLRAARPKPAPVNRFRALNEVGDAQQVAQRFTPPPSVDQYRRPLGEIGATQQQVGAFQTLSAQEAQQRAPRTGISAGQYVGRALSALDQPLVNTDTGIGAVDIAARELSRPTNLIAALAPGLSFAPKAGYGVRLAAEAAASAVGRGASERVAEATQNAPAPVRIGAPIAAGLAAGIAGGVGTARALGAAGAGARAAGRSLDDAAVRAAAGPTDSATAQVAERLGTALPGAETGQGTRFIRRIAGAQDQEFTPAADEAVAALQDALKAEVALRRSGVIETEKAAGRAQQAARIAGNMEAARASGATLSETVQAARAGAKVGTLRKTFGQPLELTEAQKTALTNKLTDALSDRSWQARMNAVFGLDALIQGENVLPNQLKTLREVFGPDLGRLAQEATGGRLSSTAQLDEAAQAAIDASLKGERAITKLEQQAQAQHRLADELAAKVGMDPTNARLKATADAARAKGVEAANRADELALAQGRRYQAAVEARAAKTDPQIARDANAAVKTAERADRLNPNDQMVLDRAKALLGEAPGVEAVDRNAIDTIDHWLRAARQYRESVGERTHSFLVRVSSALTGDLADSYLTGLYHSKAWVQRALEMGGTDSAIAKKVSDLLVEAELKARYPGGIPEHIAAEIEKVKGLAHGSNFDQTLQGMAAFSQEWKNLAFGPADIGVLGQQVVGAAHLGAANILTGVVNRLLSAMGHPLFTDPLLADGSVLARRIQYARDGLAMNVSTGAVQPGEGLGLLSNLGPAGRAADKWINWNTRLQFDKILGGLRTLDHEGNLAILKLTGQDITDPAVRSTSAAFANTATSYAPAALNARRAAVETAALMTPSMRRAQVTAIIQMAKVFLPGTTSAERTLGSIAILNKVAVTLAIAKLVHDNIGEGEFIMDPTKKGFGYITTKLKNSKGENVVINLFPQEQVQNAILKSARLLAEGDPVAAAKEWVKLGLGSSGPALQVGEKAAGYGYQPGRGYAFGDYGEGQTGSQRALSLAPVPPVASSALQGDLSPQTAPLEAAGFNNYPESGSAAVRRGVQTPELGVQQQFDSIAASAWQSVQNQPSLQRMTGDYPNHYEWQQAKYAEVKAQISSQHPGWGAGQLEAEAKKRVDAYPLEDAYRQLKNALETKWVIAHPREAIARWNADAGKAWNDRTKWEPNAKQKEILLAYQEQHAVASR